MTLSFRSVLVGAALLAFAPGCGSTVEQREADDSDDPAAGDVADPGDAGDDAGEADDGDDGGAGGPIEDPDQPARSSMCPSAVFSGGADDAVAVSWSDAAARLVLRDGTVRDLALPTEAPPADTNAYVGVVVGPDRVVVARGWNTFGEVPTAHTTIRWFDRRGTLIDEIASDEGLWPSFVGADGTTVLYRGLADWGFVARLADGTVRDLEGLDVWAAPLASGWIRGYDGEAGRAVFVHPATQQRIDVDAITYPAFVDDGFVFLEPGDGAPVLVHATPEETTRTELSAVGGVALEHLSLVPVARSRWALIDDYTDGRAWRVDVVEGVAELVSATPPAGSELLEDQCGLARPTLASTGELVGGLRTGGDGQAALADVGGAWRTIGRPYAQPGFFSVAETAGTFVVTAGDGSQTYCPVLGWDVPPTSEALAVDKVQIVRPAEDVVRILDQVDPWSIGASPDGGCLTFTTGAFDGTEVRRSIVDLRGDDAVELDGAWFAWIP